MIAYKNCSPSELNYTLGKGGNVTIKVNGKTITLTFKDVSATANCSAVEYGYLEMYNIEIEEGRYFSVTDNEEGLQRIILTHDLAEKLFEDAKEAVGKNIMLVADNVTFGFQVIGVLKDQTVGMETGTAFIPRGFYAKKIAPNPAASTVLVQVTSAEKSTEMVSTLTTSPSRKPLLIANPSCDLAYLLKILAAPA